MISYSFLWSEEAEQGRVEGSKDRPWAILDEFNVFAWPGYDLRPIREKPGRVDYGFLPPRLFNEMIETIRRLDEQEAIARTSRDF